MVLHRNLGDLSRRMSGQESDGAVVALKRVTTVEQRAPTLKEQIKLRGRLIGGNIYDRKSASRASVRDAGETFRMERQARREGKKRTEVQTS
jgi:hypothetical protein